MLAFCTARLAPSDIPSHPSLSLVRRRPAASLTYSDCLLILITIIWLIRINTRVVRCMLMISTICTVLNQLHTARFDAAPLAALTSGWLTPPVRPAHPAPEPLSREFLDDSLRPRHSVVKFSNDVCERLRHDRLSPAAARPLASHTSHHRAGAPPAAAPLTNASVVFLSPPSALSLARGGGGDCLAL